MTKPYKGPTRLLDIARMAGVSVVTAAKAINGTGGNTRVSEATAQRIREMAIKYNYRPNQAARQLAGKKSGVVGVLIAGFDMPTVPALLTHLEQQTRAHEQHIIIAQTGTQPERFVQCLDEFVARGVDGVICVHNVLRQWSSKHLQPLARLKNVVFIDRTEFDLPESCYVYMDRADGVELAYDHLVTQGCKRIALSLHALSSPVLQQRHRGYLRAAQKHQRTDTTGLVWIGDNEGMYPEPADTASEIEQLLIRSKADAVICTNDYWAAELINALRDRKIRVPEDVKIVGFNNTEPVCQAVRPRLTTIDHQYDLIAAKAVDLLHRMIKDETVPAEERVTTVPPRLVVRESA